MSLNKKIRLTLGKLILCLTTFQKSEMFKRMFKYACKKSGYDQNYPNNFQNVITVIFILQR